MNHKAMPYVLPASSLVAIMLAAIVAGPQITGFFVFNPNSMLNAEIKITADELLPQEAMVFIYLQKNNQIVKEISKTTIHVFINQFPAQTGLKHEYGNNYELDYEGFGYIGSNIFNIKNLNVGELRTGTYVLKTKITYKGKIISETEQEIEF